MIKNEVKETLNQNQEIIIPLKEYKKAEKNESKAQKKRTIFAVINLFEIGLEPLAISKILGIKTDMLSKINSSNDYENPIDIPYFVHLLSGISKWQKRYESELEQIKTGEVENFMEKMDEVINEVEQSSRLKH